MIYFIVGILIGLSAGIHVGIYLNWIKRKLENIWDRDPEPSAQVITPLQPGYSDVNELSAIVNPKTPEQVEREEQARVRGL